MPSCLFAPEELLDFAVKSFSDRRLGCIRGETHRLTHMHLDCAGTEPAAAALLQVAQPANGYRQHRRARLLDQQPDAGTKAPQLAGLRTRSLGEDQHVIAVVERFA